jgi:hypothetical protein
VEGKGETIYIKRYHTMVLLPDVGVPLVSTHLLCVHAAGVPGMGEGNEESAAGMPRPHAD